MVFFIFMVSNMGGCLTPIGDPPLLMGFMRGVPFSGASSSSHCFFLIWLFFCLHFIIWINGHIRRGYCRGRKPDISNPVQSSESMVCTIFVFLLMIVGAVILSGVLPGMPAFQDGAGNVKGIHIFGEVTLSFPALIEIAVILLAAWLSFRTTKQEIRRRNHFTWGAIKEVAVLFIGIFITMQPALMLLKSVRT